MPVTLQGSGALQVLVAGAGASGDASGKRLAIGTPFSPLGRAATPYNPLH